MINPQRFFLAGAGGAILLFALSFVHPFGNPRSVGGAPGPLLVGAQISDSVWELVGRKCGNCHSERVEWPFYANFAPVSWLVERDVTEARSHMNLSQWDTYNSVDKEDLLSRLAAEVRTGEMPPRRYTAIHRDARLTPEEQNSLYEWARAERKQLKKEVQESEGRK
jgi:cytochrome c